MALYLVGDIHGCIRELEAILERVDFDPQKDQLWSVGDLVGRGPEPQAVLEFVNQLGSAFRCVLGNHDLHLLSVLCGVKKPHAEDNTASLLAPAQRDRWINWLRQQPLMLSHAKHAVSMTHAGIFPQWSLPQAQAYADEVSQRLAQDNFTDYLHAMYHNEPTCWRDDYNAQTRFRFIVNAFTRMRYCRQGDDDLHLDLSCKLSPAQAPTNVRPWFNFWREQPTTLVFGHWAALNGKTNRTDVIALDTGCVWGNQLTLFDFAQQRLYHQKALKY